jgi:type-F conjugative transfer system pilin assembly protein TrbC
MGKNMHRLAIFFVAIVIVLNAIALKCFAANSEDYASFAEQKKTEQSQVIAPYLNDVAEIKAQVTEKMKTSEFQDFMKTATESKGESLLHAPGDEHVTSPVLIFVSFSMPADSLKLWLEQAHKAGAKVVIRGLVNNSFKQTRLAVGQLLGKNIGGLQIDPTLFSRFAINKVPAVVVTVSSACPKNVSCMPDFDVIYGNSSLNYALEKLAKADTVRSSIAIDSLKKLRG